MKILAYLRKENETPSLKMYTCMFATWIFEPFFLMPIIKIKIILQPPVPLFICLYLNLGCTLNSYGNFKEVLNVSHKK